MKIPAFFLLILTVEASTYGAEWYENLAPGVTRVEILQIAGSPSSIKSGTNSYYSQNGKIDYPAQIDRYDSTDGYIELIYDKDVLINGTLYSIEGQRLKTHYYYFREFLSDDQIQIRRDYMKARQFTLLPNFRYHHFIRTTRYEGAECYPVDDSVLIIYPIAFIGSGFFADKTSRTILLDEIKHESILYRAFDNWENLRPPQVDDQKLEEREKLIETIEMDDSYNRISQDILGPPDSTMGSGIPYVLYYLKKGLVTGIRMGKEIAIISIQGSDGLSRSTIKKCRSQKGEFVGMTCNP